MSAQRGLAAADTATTRSIERLSSGFRVNRAADDAAGLGISEGLRAQIGGMTQALRNTRDGISVVQTAEGALGQSAGLLQRMRDLAVQAANVGGLDTGAISAVQQEMGQLKAELDRIAATTSFNGTRLLDGSYQGLFQVGADVGDTLGIVIGSTGASGLGLDGLDVRRTLDPDELTSPALGPQPDLDRGRLAFLGVATSPGGIASLTGKVTIGSYELDLGAVDYTGAVSVADHVARLNAAAAAASGFAYEVDLFKADAEDLIFRGPMPASGASSATLAAISPHHVAASGSLAPPPATVVSAATTTSPPSGGRISFPGRSAADLPTMRGIVSVDGHTLDLGTVTYQDTDGDGAVDGDEALAQLNAAAALAGLAGGFSDGPVSVLGDDVYTELPSMLRFSGPAPAASATPAELAALSPVFLHVPDAISAIDGAIRSVSSQRAELGAVQNRLEHTLSRLSTSIENTTAAESRIRDTDMAVETTRLARAQILTQAGTAMLAQANQTPRGVLALLPG